jgi:Tol biopolymer transport system component
VTGETMFKNFIKILAIGILFFTWSCSGSRSGEESAPQFANEEMQDRVDDLLDKINDNPNNPEYRRQLAEIYADNGQGIEALKTLEAGLAIDPNDSETKFLYGQIAEKMGDNRRAFTAYKEVLQSSTGNDYLDRIAPKFVDAFAVTKVIGTSANEAFGSFSGDGDKIVFQADPDGNWDLFEYTISTQETVQLTATPAHEETPVYNPKSNFIAYTSTVEDHRNVDYDMLVRNIFLFDRDNNRHTNITLNSSDDWRPKYSTNGEFISFVSERDDLRDVDFSQLKGEIYIMEKDGRFQLRLTKNDAQDGGATIMPGSTEEDGTVYFDSDRNGKFEIFKIDFHGKETTQITFNPNSNDVSPDISPSGDKVVFFSDRDGNYELYLMNSDGSAQMRLTSNPGDDLNPIFSPDGTKILFHSNRSGNFDIYLLDLNTQSSAPEMFEVIANIDQALQAL